MAALKEKNVKMVNIPRSVTDEFYRYKMPDLIAKVACSLIYKVLLFRLKDVVMVLRQLS